MARLPDTTSTPGRMRALLPFILLPITTSAQYYDQNFDGTNWNPLPYFIDTASTDLWQVGAPQKGFFNAPLSSPNVIVTDTVNPYPAGNTSSFTVKAATNVFGFWPVFFLRFYHAFDTDTLLEGGYLEVSWDNGASWTNIYDDWVLPLTVENYYTDTWTPVQPDTLPNGHMGYSGSTGSIVSGLRWVYSTFCWENIGFPPADSLFVRFTFTSDSTGTPRDGWMIDDMTLGSYMVHPIIAYTRMDDYLLVAPNPVNDRLKVMYDVDADHTRVVLSLFDVEGRHVRTLRDQVMPRSVDHFILDRDDLPSANGLYILRGSIGNRQVERRIVVEGR